MLQIIALALVLCIASCAMVSDEIRPELVNDQCPDKFLTPFEYESVVQYRTVKRTKRTEFPCVLITQCSTDRLGNLEKQARAWGGALSVGIYIPTGTISEKVKALQTVHNFATRLSKDRTFYGWITISILFGHEEFPWRWNCSDPEAVGFPLYPINALRNLAAAGVGGEDGPNSQLYFLADVDFIPSPGLELLTYKNAHKGLIERCQLGHAIVIPAFESRKKFDFPTLDFVINGLKSGDVFQFHGRRFAVGHNPTNSTKWKEHSSQRDASHTSLLPTHTHRTTYQVQNRAGYEPYIIISRDLFVPYDERYRGYGFNKIVQLKWVSTRGVSFHVLPGHFILAFAHPDTEVYKHTRGVYTKRIFAAYNDSLHEMKAHKLPKLSNATWTLLQTQRIEINPMTYNYSLNSRVNGSAGVLSLSFIEDLRWRAHLPGQTWSQYFFGV